MDSLPWRLSKVGIITEVLKKKKKKDLLIRKFHLGGRPLGSA